MWDQTDALIVTTSNSYLSVTVTRFQIFHNVISPRNLLTGSAEHFS